MRAGLEKTPGFPTASPAIIRSACGRWEQLDGYQTDQTGKSVTKTCKTVLTIFQFATLTPVEPRLIKKLLPPLTKIIRETGAMSLLYECINGIIQGGILEAVEGTTEGEEVARLCVGKLRGMMVIEGDANCKLSSAIISTYPSHSHLQ